MGVGVPGRADPRAAIARWAGLLGFAVLGGGLFGTGGAMAHPPTGHGDPGWDWPGSGAPTGFAHQMTATGAIEECAGPSPNQGSVPIDEDLAITGSFAAELEGA